MEHRISAAELRKLIEAASAAMQNAYVPVTRFPTGAAVLTVSGQIFAGCNTQSVISGLGVCAERSAIDHAVVFGEYCYRAIAVTSELEDPISPYGMCLQYIGEFTRIVEDDIVIIIVASTGNIRRSSVKQLSHAIFGPVDLGLDLSQYLDRRDV
jgi:cytidine deaminase